MGFGALMRRISEMFDAGMHCWPIMELAINALVSNNSIETLVSGRICRRVNILDLPLDDVRNGNRTRRTYIDSVSCSTLLYRDIFELLFGFPR